MQEGRIMVQYTLMMLRTYGRIWGWMTENCGFFASSAYSPQIRHIPSKTLIYLENQYNVK